MMTEIEFQELDTYLKAEEISRSNKIKRLRKVILDSMLYKSSLVHFRKNLRWYEFISKIKKTIQIRAASRELDRLFNILGSLMVIE